MKNSSYLLFILSICLFSCQNGEKSNKHEVPVLSVDCNINPDPAEVEKMLSNMEIPND